MRRAIVVGVAALATVAAGCGGRPTVPDAEWVSLVCRGAARWDARVDRAVTRVQTQSSDDRAIGIDELARTIGDVVEEVDALPSPESDSGRRGEELLDAWAHRFETRVREFQNAIRELPTDASREEAATAWFKLEPISYDRPVYVVPLVGIAVGEELKKAFERTRACRTLGKRPTPPGTNRPYRPDFVPGQTWASRICARLSAYEKEIWPVYGDVRAMRVFPGVITKSRVLADIANAGRAIRRMSTDVKAIPAPRIPGGQRAKKLVDELVGFRTGDLEELAEVRRSLQADPSRAEIVRLLGGMAGIDGLQLVLLHAATTGSGPYDFTGVLPPAAARAFQNSEVCLPRRVG